MRIYLIACLIICLSCNTKKLSDEKLCKDFIYLNKNKKFNYLFEVSTINCRNISNYNKAINQNKIDLGEIAVFCKQKIESDYILVPTRIQKFQTTNLKYINQDLFYRCRNNGIIDSLFYKKFISNILSEFNSIKTPIYHNNNFVTLYSNPKLGHFVEFILKDNVEVYYLGDEDSLNEFWKNEFKKFIKVDQNWFYIFPKNS